MWEFSSSKKKTNLTLEQEDDWCKKMKLEVKTFDEELRDEIWWDTVRIRQVLVGLREERGEEGKYWTKNYKILEKESELQEIGKITDF